jgi:serine/threonine-protein kinase
MRGSGPVSIKARQKLGKYKIEKRLSEGGFATVYRAFDTIEGVHVALKIPRGPKLTEESLKDFRREVRLAARLEHPNILPLKDASVIGDTFVITFPLGERTLADRLCKRLSLKSAISLSEQILEALAYAHQQRIIHCDVKPENMVLFPGERLRLGDFGIAKFAQKTIQGSGTGTIGYMAPEQAMGKPSQRSDVFSAGLTIYRMFTGEWPEWPYSWPPPGIRRLRARIHPDFVAFLQKAIDADPRRRFRDAEQMRNAFLRLKARVLSHAERRRSRTA